MNPRTIPSDNEGKILYGVQVFSIQYSLVVRKINKQSGFTNNSILTGCFILNARVYNVFNLKLTNFAWHIPGKWCNFKPCRRYLRPIDLYFFIFQKPEKRIDVFDVSGSKDARYKNSNNQQTSDKTPKITDSLWSQQEMTSTGASAQRSGDELESRRQKRVQRVKPWVSQRSKAKDNKSIRNLIKNIFFLDFFN